MYGRFICLSYQVFTKLYDSTVLSIVNYGASIWGQKAYRCITAVQNRAERFSLGVGKFTPSAASQGDMGWIPIETRQWDSVVRQYRRLCNMDNIRLNKRVFLWAHGLRERFKNWNSVFCDRLTSLNLAAYTDINTPIGTKKLVKLVSDANLNNFVTTWHETLNRQRARRGQGNNKLRTYRTFKFSYGAEKYVTSIIPRANRSALAKLRCGTAPIRIETGRYEGLPVDQRLCFHCATIIKK